MTLDIPKLRALCEDNEQDWDDDNSCPHCGTFIQFYFGLEPRGLCCQCADDMNTLLLAAFAELERRSAAPGCECWGEGGHLAFCTARTTP